MSEAAEDPAAPDDDRQRRLAAATLAILRVLSKHHAPWRLADVRVVYGENAISITLQLTRPL